MTSYDYDILVIGARHAACLAHPSSNDRPKPVEPTWPMLGRRLALLAQPRIYPRSVDESMVDRPASRGLAP
jgi:hypothetical protein